MRVKVHASNTGLSQIAILALSFLILLVYPSQAQISRKVESLSNMQSGTNASDNVQDLMKTRQDQFLAITEQQEPFTDISAALVGVNSGSIAWGDYDNDEDLDILLTGWDGNLNEISKIYRNDGGSFVDISASLTQVTRSSVAWGDYDNDGDLDILLAGFTNDTPPVLRIAKIYRNESGSFVDIFASLSGVENCGVAWGDYDNDGDLDILLTGTGNSYTSKIYRNDGQRFVDISASLTAVIQSANAWGDYDNDGDLDIVMTGFAASGYISKVYRNDEGIFVDIAASLTGVNLGSVVWGDYDNDGDLDIVLTGLQSISPFTVISKVYRNDGGSFMDISAALTGVADGSATWGDYDNDGDLDILLTGWTGSTNISKVYRNDGGIFVDIGAVLTEVRNSSADWGDYDNDGDLDILLTGFSGSTSVTKIYRNNIGTPNTVPTPPASLASAVTDNSVNLSWNKSTDNQTVQNSLTYNLRVGRTPGGSEIVTPMANVTTGYRRIPKLGNTNHRNSWTIKNLPEGTYYWSVQAIDNGFAGSALAAEQSFTITWPFTEIPFSLVGAQYSSVAWGDYDNDGDFDILLTGLSSSNVATSKVYRNDGNGVFTDINANLAAASSGSVSWGDYDNDDDLDLLLTGLSGSSRISKVYRNDGNNIFTDSGANLMGVFFSSVAWGDYDNDGDLDILLTGSASGGPVSKVYRNDGNGVFSDINASLTAASEGFIAWGDYDNDGDLDILLTGFVPPNIRISKVYRNDGNEVFTDINATLIGVANSSGSWGDYDNDGDLDILLAGFAGLNSISKVYRNDGNGVFTDINANLTGTGVSVCSAAWGDYDNDGDLDILLTGSTGSSGIAKVYRNDGIGVFTDINADLTGVFRSSVAWGDYDNDGDLDILLTGLDNSFAPVSKLYRNDGSVFNTAPTAPSNITHSVAGDSVILSWDPASDNETPSLGLSSNLRIGRTPGGNEVMPAHADNASGYRRIVAIGNSQKRTSWTIKKLPSGTYYWSVQAIDHAFAGSAFAREQSFTICTFCGDVNEDGVVNSTDALIILSCELGLACPPNFRPECGDVNLDGATNSTDALIILTCDIGLPQCPPNVGKLGGCAQK